MRGKPSTKSTALDRERLPRARAALGRVAAVEVLSLDEGRTLSPKEIAYETQASLSSVSYHVRVLEIIGMVEVAGEQLGAGTYERFYRLVEPLPQTLAPESDDSLPR